MLGVSLTAHLLVLGAQLITYRWKGWSAPTRPLKLIYEREALRNNYEQAREELQRAQARLKDLRTSASFLSVGTTAGGALSRALLGPGPSDLSQTMPEIRIGGGGALGLPSAAASNVEGWAAAIDLTNISEAAQGNPVLLSYFSAIREQIQRTANEQPWLRHGASTEGTIYIGFVISRMGVIQSAAIIPEKSAPSTLLQDVSLRIIQAASPFPPFPPSFQESSKTVMVPIEFVLGS